MTRQMWLVFFGKARTTPAEHAHDNPPVILVPLIILAVLSLVGGALNLPSLHSFEHWLDYTLNPGAHSAVEVPETVESAVELAMGAKAVSETEQAEFAGVLGYTWGGLDPVLAIGTTLLALAAFGLGYYLYARRYEALQSLPVARRPDDPLRSMIGPLFSVFENKYWVDELYWAMILTPYIGLARFLAQVVDWRFWHDFFHDKILKGGFDLFSRLLSVQIDLGGIDAIAKGLAVSMRELAFSLRRLQTGQVRNYAFTVLVGAVLILGYLLYANFNLMATLP
jgi:NADH-quinone oxidoreductase subunit L